MKFDSNSYIPLESSVVLRMAEKRLNDITEWRKQQWTRLIADYRANRDWWKRYMPWLKDLTEDEIRQRIASDRDWRWSMPDFACRRDEDTCWSLRRAARAGSTVYVHTDDFRVLSVNQAP